MISDTLQNLARYRGLHPNLDKAIDFVQGRDLSALPLGKTVIDGDQVFVNVMDADLRPAEGSTAELHRLYADLQIDLTGSEGWGFSTARPEEVSPFDAASDYGAVQATDTTTGVLGEGRCVIFLPGEIHRPSLIHGDCTRLRKAVVKIKMEE